MEYLTRKVPHKIGPTPLPAVMAAAAGMLDEFAERDNLIDAPVVAGQLRALMLALQDGKPWEPEAEETLVDRLDLHYRDRAGGEAAAKTLTRLCVINPDESITIPKAHKLLLVRMFMALGAPSPFLVDLMRRGKALINPGSTSVD
ncbi:hypothetical protein MARCHEWKA_02850 [Brevundimonas phage vB_BpoS-Marchewka]|uniref:Uncharacterized protein n=1 Tax=Brevundimonas phage vB_BpoS-Marchewka TaxID=2948604 RepID=A0A9E7N5G7_9CAUD|nr:hypothetical protein MARCHEWKA_02850 [Brevundimonas phage vB_BpoS-Marchewka]UTC29244.1 hypothetical protein BAMBUS_01620 [Brevundimonas phage vB_BpoS-Bambus]